MNIFKLFNLAALKKDFAVLASCFLFITFFSASSVKAQAGAVFDRMWIDYNMTEGGQKGMLLHTKFTVNNLKSTDCQVRIKFFYDDETPLKDNNKRFYTTDGNVAVFRDLKPGYDTTVYNDLQIFMPYDELDLPYGEFKLKMDVDLIYNSGDLIQHMTWYDFQYSKKVPATTTTNTSTTTNSSTPTATFDRMWIDYDVTEGEKLGMRIHAKFSVAKMKGIKGYFAMYFELENGVRLKSYDNTFQSKANDVAAFREITPGYDPAVYNDYSIFMPYSELHLPTGEYNLKIDADLIYENGTLIQHLGFHNFRYWKK